MRGSIHSDQRCVVCGGHLRDTGRDLSCKDHPQSRATRYKIRFGNITKRFKSYDDAQRFLNGVRFKTDEKTFDSRDYRRDNPLSFTNISQKWAGMKEKVIRPTSFRSLSNHLDKAQAYFGHMNVKDIRYSHLEDFITALSVGEKTKHNVLATLHSLFVWMKKRQDIREVPDFPEVRFDLGYRKTVDKEIQQSILDDIEKHEPFKVWMGIRFLATYISIRPMELMNITYANVDLKNGYLYIPHPKEKKYKAVPVLPEDMVLLQGQAKEMPSMFVFGGVKRFGENRFYKAWIRACSRLGIEGVDLYGGTRHSSARALRKFFSPEEIKRATMHSSNAAFERYFCMESDDVRSIYRRSADVIKIDNGLTTENRGTGVLKNAVSS